MLKISPFKIVHASFYYILPVADPWLFQVDNFKHFKIVQGTNLEAGKILKCFKLHMAQPMWYRQF